MKKIIGILLISQMSFASEFTMIVDKKTNQYTPIKLDSCKNIKSMNQNAKSGIYETKYGSIECDMDYKDGSGFLKTQIMKPSGTEISYCAIWREDGELRSCINFEDTLTFNLNKEKRAFIELDTMPYSSYPVCNNNESTISVSEVDIQYKVGETKHHVVDLSNETNGHKSLILRFQEDKNILGECDNNISIKNIFLYQQ